MQTINNFNLFCSQRNLPIKNLERFSTVLKQILATNTSCFIMGGAIRRILLGEEGIKSDVDLFFTSDADFGKALQTFHNNKDIFKFEKETNNHVCFIWLEQNVPVQLIKIIPKQDCNVEDILNEFDYTICQFAVNYKNLDVLYSGDSSLFDLGRKRLVINNITYPVASLRRLIKYSKQGFYACQGCLQHFLESTKELDLNNVIEYID
jgi:hypothetical protein